MTDASRTPGAAARATGYHAHVYFDDAHFDGARVLCEAAAQRFELRLGRMHRAPVGPHPIGSCQLAFAPPVLGELLAWLVENRDGLTVFVHAQTGHDLRDHTEHVMWLGDSMPLNLECFS